MNIKPESILKRFNDVRVNVNSSHRIEVAVKDNRRLLSNHALNILSVFSRPVSVQQALEELNTSSVQDWIELTDTIKKLCQIGALVFDSEEHFISDRNVKSFGAAPIHISMLNDRTRTGGFIEAIKIVVKEGDVVVDIGTGTGVLAIAAARAGAKKVYAIEAGAMAEVAQAVIAQAGLSEVITVIRGWSIQVELPEQADVLVSEIIGNDPFGEKVMQTFMDARQRLLKPNARIIPGAMKVFGLPVEIPELLLRNRVLAKSQIEDWKNWYDIDFSALKNIQNFHFNALLNLKTEKARKLKTLGSPILLSETNFHTFEHLIIKNKVAVTLQQPYNGLLIYFELDLDGKVLSTHPGVTDFNNHWLNPVWYVTEASSIDVGEDYILEFSYGENNDCQVKIEK